MTTEATDVVLTVDELAARWRCTRRIVLEAVHAGKLRAFKVGKRRYRVTLAEVERYERTRDAA